MKYPKFRQWNPHNEEFTYWGRISEGTTALPTTVGGVELETPDEVYTGIKDGIGVEVYESDVCRVQGKNYVYHFKVTLGELGNFYVDPVGDMPDYLDWNEVMCDKINNVMVVDNIHHNELWEQTYGN